MMRELIHTAACICALITASAVTQSPGSDPASDSAGGAKFPWPQSAPAVVPPSPQPPSAEVRGSIAVRALQGTSGGPAIGSVPVEIELQHRGLTVDTIKAQTDEHGIVVIENLPVAMGIQPVVRVQYANLTYQVQAGLMDAAHPQQQIDVLCYEPTEQPPPWRVQMRHIMLAQAPGGVQVTEIMVLENPAAQTWIGIPIGGSKRITTAFDLPHGARDIHLGNGFHDWCCSTFAEGQLVNHLPLMPKSTEMMFTYFVPGADGSASIDITAPSPVDNMMVLVPDSLKAESVKGLEPGGSQSMGDGNVSAYLASNVKAGARVGLVLSGLPGSNVVAGNAGAGGTTHTARLVAAVGGGLIILVAIAMLLVRAGASGRSSSGSAV